MLQILAGQVEFYPDSREEQLPGFSPQFPLISSNVALQNGSPWHWHRCFELFYIESGAVEYHTPHMQRLFRAGSGGLVNSNVLHGTRCTVAGTTERLHLFEPELLAGVPGGTVEQRYLAPLLAEGAPEMLILSPEEPVQKAALELLRQSLHLDESAFGYELELQSLLMRVWVQLLRPLAQNTSTAPGRTDPAEKKVKQMMLYVRAHYAEKITAADLAAAAFCSERECYRSFQTCLHQTPTEYIRHIRLQTACRQLLEGDTPVTTIAQDCGFGSSSYFGAQFRQEFGCTPVQYREKWQDPENNGHKSNSDTPV